MAGPSHDVVAGRLRVLDRPRIEQPAPLIGPDLPVEREARRGLRAAGRASAMRARRSRRAAPASARSMLRQTTPVPASSMSRPSSLAESQARLRRTASPWFIPPAAASARSAIGAMLCWWTE
jgi:hypothetical protein